MNLLLTTEQAMSNLAQSASISQYETLFSSVQYYTGIDNQDMKGPCVICYAQNATPDSENPNVGVYHLKGSVIVKERASKTTTNTTLSDTIFRQFLTGSIENDLVTNAQSLIVYLVRVEDETSGIENKFWVSTLQMDICCAAAQ